ISSGNDVDKALGILFNRFKTALNGGKVKVSGSLAKSTLSSLSYALTGIPKVSANFIRLMREEPDVYRHLLRRLMGEYPQSPGSVMYIFSFVNIGDKVAPLVCGRVNAEYGITVKRTNRTFGMLEDLVGDGVIQFITMLRILENLGHEPYLNQLMGLMSVNEDDAARDAIKGAWNDTISEIRGLFKDLLPEIAPNCSGLECYNMLLSRAMAKWPELSEDYRREFLLRVAEAWLIALGALGQYFTKIPEYHGMWA
ncbi:hypothetical protein, partial [Caldivirga sp.]|uniref:hypothetical protein n=1 Tax=Caldivirga sp. TaxID=2080243 RepID=UPI003D14B62A